MLDLWPNHPGIEIFKHHIFFPSILCLTHLHNHPDSVQRTTTAQIQKIYNNILLSRWHWSTMNKFPEKLVPFLAETGKKILHWIIVISSCFQLFITISHSLLYNSYTTPCVCVCMYDVVYLAAASLTRLLSLFFAATYRWWSRCVAAQSSF
jgi:hypothetical protein